MVLSSVQDKVSVMTRLSEFFLKFSFYRVTVATFFEKDPILCQLSIVTADYTASIVAQQVVLLSYSAGCSL